MSKPATLIAAILLAIVTGAHLLRLVFGVGVTIGDWLVPMWVSVLGSLVAAGLAVMLWRERRGDD